MLTTRTDHDGWTEIRVWNADTPPWNYYGIVCMDVDIDEDGQRAAPTSTISLLVAAGVATVETTYRLAAEYTYVASIAEALQVEKRAGYEERHVHHES